MPEKRPWNFWDFMFTIIMHNVHAWSKMTVPLLICRKQSWFCFMILFHTACHLTQTFPFSIACRFRFFYSCMYAHARIYFVNVRINLCVCIHFASSTLNMMVSRSSTTNMKVYIAFMVLQSINFCYHTETETYYGRYDILMIFHFQVWHSHYGMTVGVQLSQFHNLICPRAL